MSVSVSPVWWWGVCWCLLHSADLPKGYAKFEISTKHLLLLYFPWLPHELVRFWSMTLIWCDCPTSWDSLMLNASLWSDSLSVPTIWLIVFSFESNILANVSSLLTVCLFYLLLKFDASNWCESISFILLSRSPFLDWLGQAILCPIMALFFILAFIKSFALTICVLRLFEAFLPASPA